MQNKINVSFRSISGGSIYPADQQPEPQQNKMSTTTTINHHGYTLPNEPRNSPRPRTTPDHGSRIPGDRSAESVESSSLLHPPPSHPLLSPGGSPRPSPLLNVRGIHSAGLKVCVPLEYIPGKLKIGAFILTLLAPGQKPRAKIQPEQKIGPDFWDF